MLVKSKGVSELIKAMCRSVLESGVGEDGETRVKSDPISEVSLGLSSVFPCPRKLYVSG